MKQVGFGFWSGGSRSRMELLYKEETERLAELKQRLKTETQKEQRALIRNEMKAVRAAYRQKKKDARRCLYGRM